MPEIKPQDICIRSDYKARLDAPAFDDTSFKDEYQLEEYRIAAAAFLKRGFHRVMDWGCGSGYKLRKLFPTEAIKVGVDVAKTVEWLRHEYPDGIWECHDEPPKYAATDMLLCIDCIEHSANPLALLLTLANINFKVGFISTPDRDVVRGINDSGPPANEHHAWEWSKEEFKSLISRFFTVRNHVATPSGGQMIEFEPKVMDVTIIAKTFCRPTLIKRLHESIRKYYPQIPFIVADDGQPYASGFNDATVHLRLPFDCGLKMGRNLALALVRTKYFLLCDDDFIFTKNTNVGMLVSILEQEKLTILGGDVRNGDETRAGNYRINLRIKDGELLFEEAQKPPVNGAVRCDKVANFYLADTDEFRRFGGWDSRLKIGGHEELFLRFKALGARVGFTDSTWILHEQDFSFSGDKVAFEKYRNERVWDFWPPIAIKEYGITRCGVWEVHHAWKGYDKYK